MLFAHQRLPQVKGQRIEGEVAVRAVVRMPVRRELYAGFEPSGG
jgi:hypothetical protein